MIAYRDPEAAARGVERIAAIVGEGAAQSIAEWMGDSPDPDQSLSNLERWLNAAPSPVMMAQELELRPQEAQTLLTILGASAPIANILIQNPDLGHLLFDLRERTRLPDRATVEAEGRQLLAAADHSAYAYDRLRFLRQRWILPIVIADLEGAYPQPAIWRALSDLADAIVTLTTDAAWTYFARANALAYPCPLHIVAFGKHGGREVNYSSDLDLVYVLRDDADESADRQAARFAGILTKAFEDQMGRGMLYRIDLRLRPYGSAGAICPTLRAVEAYYKLYAEPWEVLALLRSRPVVADDDVHRRWEAMRQTHCFRPAWSDVTLEQMADMRRRIDEHAAPDDLKRAAGGIRDVEFAVQLRQIVLGHAHPAAQTLGCLDAIAVLRDIGGLAPAIADDFAAGYEYLRKLEHRIQLIDDQQAHRMPESTVKRAAIAHLMGCGAIEGLESRTYRWRQTIYARYLECGHPGEGVPDDRRIVRQLAGNQAAAITAWFDSMTPPEPFYAALCENRDSLDRAIRVVRDAPALHPQLMRRTNLAEQIISGEVEEPALPARTTAGFAENWSGRLIRWLLAPDEDLAFDLADRLDALTLQLAAEVGLAVDIFALGSHGNREPTANSDLDLIFLVESPDNQAVAEVAAQRFLRRVGELRQTGGHVEADFRLRPEGRKGLLVRSYQGMQTYGDTDMEAWERFALGHARQIAGNPEAARILASVAYDTPLDAPRLDELMRMKRRIETERVTPTQLDRNIKLGHGGLNDIEWAVHLAEMRRGHPATSPDLPSRTRILAQGGQFNAVETDALLDAHRFLYDLRVRMQLQGIGDDVLPENPDRLDRLARMAGFPVGNALLAAHRAHARRVRAIYEETVERLFR